jgi:hypothetical integral membrane protein (TIGR02206 family)
VSEAAAQYGYFFVRGWLKFPDTLPLELCDATLCVATIALFTLNPLSVDLAYYGAMAGTSMALLMPDLWEPFPSYATVQFFIVHGLVITSVLYLIWSGQARLRPGSSWRALLALNIFASLVGTIDFLFGANYMYLRAKPQNPSLLDFFGRWPWYVVTAELVALALFTLLYLPFRSHRGSPTGSLPPS